MAVVLGGGASDGPPPVGLDTAIAVRVRPETQAVRLVFEGPVQFNTETQEHVRETVLPAADAVTGALGCPVSGYAVSAVNLGAASLRDMGTEVSGYSADASLFLALLSAATSIPIPGDLLVTGHLASPDGELRPVRYLAEKLEAAARVEDIRRFVYASPLADASTTVLEAEACERFRCARARAKGRVKILEVTDVGELVQEAFGARDIVQSALRRRFYMAEAPSPSDASPLARAVHVLRAGHPQKFWSVLERDLLGKHMAPAKLLLDAWVGFHVSSGTYPTTFGHRLLALVHALPRTARQAVLRANLIPAERGLQLAKLAEETDLPDLDKLTRFLTGTLSREDMDRVQPTAPSSAPDTAEALEELLRAIAPEALAASIRRPADNARLSYTADSVVLEDYGEFLDAIGAYYRHLCRHFEDGVSSGNPGIADARAIDLLEEAFAKQGGLAGAQAEARDAVQGGMRYVLDAMTYTFIWREQIRFVNAVLVQTFDPLHWEERVSLTKSFVAAIAHGLPPEIASQPPERYARSVENLARIYVNSMENVRAALRAL